jgi:two-component system OmpR family response regulator
MNILLIEDDEKVGAFLKDNLSRENYQVSLLTSFRDCEQFLERPQFSPSLFIMDRLLGNDDTKALIKKIKQKFSSSSILILSALNTPSEKANLLDEGVDDYLGKPFSLVELQARVRALIRRNKNSSKSVTGFYTQVSDIVIDLKSRTVLCHGQKIDFTPKEFALFVNFCEHKNRVFSKYQLLDIIWETNLDIESNVIEVNVMNIRKKLEHSGSTIKIQSKRNVGYWLEA